MNNNIIFEFIVLIYKTKRDLHVGQVKFEDDSNHFIKQILWNKLL